MTKLTCLVAALLLGPSVASADLICLNTGEVIDTPRAESGYGSVQFRVPGSPVVHSVGKAEVWAVIRGRGRCFLRGVIHLASGQAFSAVRIREEADEVFYEERALAW